MLFKNYRVALPNPDKMTMSELYQYNGRSNKMLQQGFRSVKMSLPFMGTSIAATLVLSYFLGKHMANRHIYGSDGKGGEITKVKTKFNEHDMEYNREFQRTYFLMEPVTKQKSTKDLELALVEKNENVSLNSPLKDFRKKAPHHKYY